MQVPCNAHGRLVKRRKTSPHSSSWPRSTNDGWCTTPCGTMLGCTRSILPPTSQWITSLSLWTFGFAWSSSNFARTLTMTSLGFVANGEYSVASAYMIQFLGSRSTIMNKTVWKVWAPPKVKFFSWLALQNRVWKTDRLKKRWWEKCAFAPFARRPTTQPHICSTDIGSCCVFG